MIDGVFDLGKEILHHIDDLGQPFGPADQEIADLFGILLVAADARYDILPTGDGLIDTAAVAAVAVEHFLHLFFG